MNGRTWLILALAWSLAAPAWAARPVGPVGQCFAHYDAGKYEDAAGCFLLRASEGGERYDAQLLYNAGNAFHRDGSFPDAIWAYRLALLDLPRDGDLRANLETARGSTTDDLPPPHERGPVGKALLAPYDSLSQREMLVVGTASWALFFLGMAVRTRRPFPFATMGALPILGIVAVLGITGHIARSRQVDRNPVAVVVVEETTLRSGRDAGSVDLARLHGGAEIAVVQEDAPWVQVTLGGDVRGWLPDASIALVRPGALR